MKGSFTILLILLFSFATLVCAKDKDLKFKKEPVNPVILSNKVKQAQPKEAIEPLSPYGEVNTDANTPMRIRKGAAIANRQIATSGNGYGWLNPAFRSIDRYQGYDDPTMGGSGTNIDFILVGYRGADASEINASEINVDGGLTAGTLYSWSGTTALNNIIGGIGGRYPGVVALDRPMVAFNQYMSGDVTTTPALSHPYLVSDWTTYGAFGGAWTTPDYIMDTGWLHPDVAANAKPEYQENRLWNGSVAVVKDVEATYHYLGVYETWFSDVEKRDPPFGYNAENDDVILTATSFDPATGWTIDTNPTMIDPQVVSVPRKAVAMNSAGFGAIVGPGHLGWHDPDSGYYYSECRITYSTTNNYGDTWSAWDTVSFGGLGFPLYHDPAQGDSMLGYWQIVGPDTIWIWYTGPTFMGTNFDMDVIVDDNDYIYVGFNSLWGRPADDGWYPSAYYSGVFMARKIPGNDWEAARIWYNNGVFEGDDYVEGRSQFFFDTEIDMSMDEVGNVYAAWLDRRRNDVEIGYLARYNGAAEPDFKTDVFTSRSLNGGADWSANPTNLSNTISLDEYELKLSLHSDSRDNGTVWVAYCMCDDPGSGTPGTDAYIDLVNQVWTGEANNFEPPSSIEEDAVAPVVRSFALEQNYPNPFNPTTRIKFIPLKSGQATLNIYSVTGEKVAELFNGFTKKGVEYAVDFNGNKLAAGIYFYRLTIGNQVEVKKMALIK